MSLLPSHDLGDDQGKLEQLLANKPRTPLFEGIAILLLYSAHQEGTDTNKEVAKNQEQRLEIYSPKY